MSEVKAHFSGETAGRYIVRAAEGGEKVIKRNFVGQVYRGELKAHLVLVTVKDIVVTHR